MTSLPSILSVSWSLSGKILVAVVFQSALTENPRGVITPRIQLKSIVHSEEILNTMNLFDLNKLPDPLTPTLFSEGSTSGAVLTLRSL